MFWLSQGDTDGLRLIERDFRVENGNGAGSLWETERAVSCISKHVRDKSTWLVYMFYTTAPFGSQGFSPGDAADDSSRIYASSALIEGMSQY